MCNKFAAGSVTQTNCDVRAWDPDTIAEVTSDWWTVACQPNQFKMPKHTFDVKNQWKTHPERGPYVTQDAHTQTHWHTRTRTHASVHPPNCIRVRLDELTRRLSLQMRLKNYFERFECVSVFDAFNCFARSLHSSEIVAKTKAIGQSHIQIFTLGFDRRRFAVFVYKMTMRARVCDCMALPFRLNVNELCTNLFLFFLWLNFFSRLFFLLISECGALSADI